MNTSVNLEIVREDFQPAFVQQPGVSFERGMSLKDIEKTVILVTLKSQHFNRTHTARVLGIGIRTLQRKLKQYRDDDKNVVIDFAS
jgi:DNA-binding NtrC family response regulator